LGRRIDYCSFTPLSVRNLSKIAHFSEGSASRILAGLGMRRASLSRGRGLVAPKARGGKTRGLNASDDMAILRIELEDIEPLIWRRVAVPVSMNLEVVHSLIQAAVRWLIQSALIT
jgi:hypothetical protein